MTNTSIVWSTPNGDDLITYMARVSNPSKQSEPSPKLIAYLIREQHWSPFEMVDMCVEINTTRAIGRQILRHGKAFRFQEFSQRYADVSALGDMFIAPKKARLQDPNNRQKSTPIFSGMTGADEILEFWDQAQNNVIDTASIAYKMALSKGIAKEIARDVLPEGLTRTRLYMKGDVRSWLHFCALRMGNGTQKECMDIASAAFVMLQENYPNTVAAWSIVNQEKGVALLKQDAWCTLIEFLAATEGKPAEDVLSGVLAIRDTYNADLT